MFESKEQPSLYYWHTGYDWGYNWYRPAPAQAPTYISPNVGPTGHPNPAKARKARKVAKASRKRNRK